MISSTFTGYPGALMKIADKKFQRTAQNILFDKLFIHGVYTHESSYNVATDSRLTWTGSLEKQHFERRTLRALEILQCIRHWPEAILGKFKVFLYELFHKIIYAYMTATA